jgi:hypothetical protein
MKVRTGAKWPKVSYYVRVYGRVVTSTPRLSIATASGHRVQLHDTLRAHANTENVTTFN